MYTTQKIILINYLREGILVTKAVSIKAGVNLVAKVYHIKKTEIIKTTKMKQNH